MNRLRLTTHGLTTDDAAMPSRPTRTLTLNSLLTPNIPEDCKPHHSTSSHMTTDEILRKIITPSLPPLQRDFSSFLRLASRKNSPFLHHTIPTDLSRISITLKVTSTQVTSRSQTMERMPAAVDPRCRWRSYKLNRLGSCCCSVRFIKRGYGCCRRELAVSLHTLSAKIGALVCVIS